MARDSLAAGSKVLAKYRLFPQLYRCER